MQGIDNAKMLIAVSLAAAILSGMGFWAHIGVGIGFSIADDVQDLQDTDPDGGIMSVAAYTWLAIEVIAGSITAVILETGPALAQAGVPAPIAYGLHAAVDISIGLVVVQFLRGLTFR